MVADDLAEAIEHSRDYGREFVIALVMACWALTWLVFVGLSYKNGDIAAGILSLGFLILPAVIEWYGDQ